MSALVFQGIKLVYGWIDSLTFNNSLYIIRARSNPVSLYLLFERPLIGDMYQQQAG